MKFAADGDLPKTYEVLTGAGGIHIYYQWPAHWPRISQASPVKGVVDVRGNGGQYGGYVLAEGSRTAAGFYVAENVANAGVPPEWIRRLVAEKPQPPKAQRPQGPALKGLFSWDGLAHSVRNAGEGNRNNSLVWAARTMCEEGAQEHEALNVLGPAASGAGLGDRKSTRL